jgi:hypothetical protein
MYLLNISAEGRKVKTPVLNADLQLAIDTSPSRSEQGQGLLPVNEAANGAYI